MCPFMVQLKQLLKAMSQQKSEWNELQDMRVPGASCCVMLLQADHLAWGVREKSVPRRWREKVLTWLPFTGAGLLSPSLWGWSWDTLVPEPGRISRVYFHWDAHLGERLSRRHHEGVSEWVGLAGIMVLGMVTCWRKAGMEQGWLEHNAVRARKRREAESCCSAARCTIGWGKWVSLAQLCTELLASWGTFF